MYGLVDDNGLFYVGQTKTPRTRFDPPNKNFQRGDHAMARIVAAGDTLRVVILREVHPPFVQEQLNKYERMEIEKYCASLVNYTCNPIAQGTEHPTGHQLCVRCSEPIRVRQSRYCYACLGSLLNKRGQSKQQLRELIRETAAQAKLSA